MDTKWIEDFLALAEHGSFTKAAEQRFVTQPAFSRRIRSLENWLGVKLVDRTTFPTRLSKTGEDMIAPMRETLAGIYQMRSRFQARADHENMLMLSTQHSLSVAFFPGWYTRIRPVLDGRGIRVNASNLHDCVDVFLAGQSDLLLCYFAPNIIPALEQRDITGLEVGHERLIPVTVPLPARTADSSNASRLRLVGFPGESFFGHLIQETCMPRVPKNTCFELVCETALSEGIKALVLQGAGMAWLPASLIETELERKQLIAVPDFPTVEMKIMLYRQATPAKPELLDFWERLQSQPPS